MRTCLLSCLFLISIAVIGQSGRESKPLYVTQYGTEQGLSQSMVRQVYQDKRGLIWIVTGDGLQCFNGEEFRAYRVTYDQSRSFSENIMRDITENSPGQFTLSTTSSLLHFDSFSGEFNVVIRTPGEYPKVYDLHIDNKPLCWLRKKGFCLADGKKLSSVEFDYGSGSKPPQLFYPDGAVKNRSGNVYIFGREGFIILKEFSTSDKKGLEAKWIPLDKGCQGITTDNTGHVFVLSGNVIHRCNPEGLLSGFYDLGSGMDADYLLADSKQNLWISDHKYRKLFCLTNGVLNEISLLTREGKHTDTVTPHVIGMFEDRQHNLWLGTDGEGVFLYSPDLFHFETARIGFTRCITSQDKQIWAGTLSNGLWRFSQDLQKGARVNPAVFSNEFYFMDLAADHLGRIWTATNKGLYVINGEGKVVYDLPVSASRGKFVLHTPDSIVVLFDNQLFYFRTGSTPARVGNKPYVLIRDLVRANGKSWAGTPFGLYFCNTSTLFDRDISFATGTKISDSPVFGIIRLKDTTWVATEKGIECFSGSGKRLKSPTCLNEIGNDVIYALQSDKQNRIWFSGNKGLGCIVQGRDRLILFNDRNNLQSLEFNANAASTSPSGWIYFGGIHGFNGLNPDHFKPDKSGPEVRLFSLSVSDTTYSKGIPPERISVFLDWKEANINGNVFTTDYPNSGMQQYSFFLKGYQKDWSPFTRNSAFTYRNLPPGKYYLWIRCMDAYKNIGKERQLVSVVVSPPFWMTWWFITLICLIMIGLTVMIVRRIQGFRYRNRLNELEHQNAIEKERLRIAKDMHDEVGASLTRISILSEIAKSSGNKPETTSEMIEQINEISGNVVDEMSEIIWAINPKNDNVESFASHIRQYIYKYLEPTGMEIKMDFQDDIPFVSMPADLRRNIFLTVKEAVHNVVKHSKAGRLMVHLSCRQSLLQIIIHDNGAGFCVEEKVGKGNGLLNMSKRIQDMGGVFSIDSSAGNGTRIEICKKFE